ncbi:MAG: hydroxymethylglutaryl-CoA synthase [Candidatus Diapherotrites archaeon]|nr:hydroxymethylglutaryl-CoA synthase [Candidatus Diapherotrites archaeon]
MSLKAKVGIVGYGVYIPPYRIKIEDIAKAWGKDGNDISKSLNVYEKAVADFDEDACTIAVEAAKNAVNDFNIDAQKIGALYVGSESHPYAVKPTASIVGDAINAGPDLMCADLQFACKAGTAGMQICYGLVKADLIEYGMAIGADTAQSRPNDALEFTAASGGAAFIIGKNEEEVIAEILDTYSYTTDTPDFWRRPKADYPSHAGRFTGEPAYFKHVISAAKKIMEKNNLHSKDFDYVVFHQPNGKFPLRAADILDFEKKKVEPGLLTPFIGNTYSGASIVGLAAVLDISKPENMILLVSYGSGAGSDAFILKVTDNIKNRYSKNKVKDMINSKVYIDYINYIKHRKKIKG